MKGLKWLLVLSSFALLSCSPSSTSSENPSPAGSSSSSSGNSSPASSEDPDAKYFIDYEDYSLPEGTFVSEEEWDMMVEQAAYNRKYNVGLDRYLSEENSDYAVRNPAEAASRSYEGSFQDVHWNFYQNRIAASVLDSQDVSSNFGGYSTRDYEEEVFFITGDDTEGYNLYFNHYETINGIEHDPFSTLVSSSATYDKNLNDVAYYYDYQVVYFAAYSEVGTAFSPEIYDVEEGVINQNSFVKNNYGTIYVTNYSVSTSLETVTVDGEEKQVPVHFMAGTQYEYENVPSLGYCLTKYTTQNMHYCSVDYYGNRLDEPAVIQKRRIETEWNYVEEKPLYPYDNPSVVTPSEVPYSVTLDAYDVTGETPTVASSASFGNITSLYKQLVDSDFSGYAFRYLSRSAAGNYKVSVKGGESTVTLGYGDITHFEDYGLTIYESTALENGIEDYGEGIVAYTVLLGKEGTVVRFAVSFLV